MSFLGRSDNFDLSVYVLNEGAIEHHKKAASTTYRRFSASEINQKSGILDLLSARFPFITMRILLRLEVRSVNCPWMISPEIVRLCSNDSFRL